MILSDETDTVKVDSGYLKNMVDNSFRLGILHVLVSRPPTLILVKKFMNLGQILPFFHDILGHFGPNLYDILW